MTEHLSSAKITTALKKVAADRKLHFNDTKILFAIERLIARLEREPKLIGHLVFKGGYILMRCLDHQRFTRDLDALAISLNRELIVPIIEKAITAPLEDRFRFGDVKHQNLVPDDPYAAFRFIIAYQLGDGPTSASEAKKFSRIHFDIGFGDVITPSPLRTKIPSLINSMNSISSLVYPIETIIAEKLETFVKRGSTNSRGKDIYDLTILLPKVANLDSLKKAIVNTFSNRETAIPETFQSYAEKLNLTFLRSSVS